MKQTQHDMQTLFAQLGEPSDEVSITRFIEIHSPIPGDIRLHEAAFWSPTQASFLNEAVLDDADWVGIIDALNSKLHRQG